MLLRYAKEYTVLTLTTTQNELGEEIPDWVESGSINTEIWPLNGKVTTGMVGVTEKSTHEAYSNDLLVKNTRLSNGSDIYLVGYIQDWGSHRQAILELV